MGMLHHYPSVNLADSSLPVYSGRVRGASLAANTLTWHELVASTPEDWSGIMIQVMAVAQVGIGFIAVGAVGAETIVANFQLMEIGFRTELFFPINITAGMRVSFALCGATTQSASAYLTGYPKSLFPAVPDITKCEAGPFDLSGSSTTYAQGAFIDPPATINTKSAWTEASRLDYSGNILQGNALPYQYKYLGFQFWTMPTSLGTDNWLSVVDVARGAVGEEVLLIENMHIRAAPANSNINFVPILWIPWNRPPGDRISWRIQHNKTTAKRMSLFLYGLR